MSHLFGAKALRPSSVIYSLLLLSLPAGRKLHLLLAHVAWEFSVKDINNLLFSSSHFQFFILIIFNNIKPYNLPLMDMVLNLVSS